MSDKPIMHGRDHRPGGMDPIPGVSVPDWISGYQTGITVASQTSPYTDVDFTGATVYTNNSTLFTIGSGTGLKINDVGFYLAFVSCIFTVSGATSSEGAEVIWNLSGIGSELNDQAPFFTAFANTAYVRSFQGFPVNVSSIGTAAPLNLRHNGGATGSVDIQFSVGRLSDDYGNF